MAERRGGRGLRRPRLVAGASAVGVLVVAAVGWWGYARMTSSDACAELAADVVDAPAIAWDDGITGSGPSWSAVLTDGVEHAAADVQPELAAAVAADQDGWDDLRAALPDRLRPVAARLRALVLEPAPASDRRSDPEVQADIAAVRRLAGGECHLV